MNDLDRTSYHGYSQDQREMEFLRLQVMEQQNIIDDLTKVQRHRGTTAARLHLQLSASPVSPELPSHISVVFEAWKSFQVNLKPSCSKLTDRPATEHIRLGTVGSGRVRVQNLGNMT